MSGSIEKSINSRYSNLAESSCCLSCGGAVLHAKCQPGEICVDLGSGRGNDALRMAEEVGKKGFVYGIDLSDGMIEMARQTASKLGVSNIEFSHCPLETLPLKSQTADLVISNCVLNHVVNKQTVWHEIYRILKKGGRFTVSDIYATEPVPEAFRNDPVAVSECWAGAVTREEYLQTIAAAGFSGIRILEESRPYDKGKIQVASFTIAGSRPSCCCSC